MRYDSELLDEVLRLTLRCQQDSPSEDDCARLSVLLAEEEEAREIYLVACDDTTTLIKYALSQEPTSSGQTSVSRLALGPTFRGLFALAVAACLVLFASWSMWFSHESPHAIASVHTDQTQQNPVPTDPTEKAESAGRIVSLENVKWAPAADVLHEWSRFAVGQSIRIEAGVVELILDNSTEIKLEGPADFRLTSLSHSVLNYGNLVARCGPEAVGFEVASPDVKVVDLGTEFGVSVQQGKHTDVVVYDGEVDLSSVSPAIPLDRRLIAGEALHISHQGAQSARITEVRGDRYLTPQFPLDRGIGNSNRILSVKDNLRSSQTAKYYRVVGRGFGEDCRAYVDRPYEWNGVDGAGLPTALVGGDYIMTFNDDKIREVEIEIDLARPSTLYLLFDDRVQPPEWLERDFVDTGWDVGMDESRPDSKLVSGVGPGDSIDHAFSVWKRDVPRPSAILLGTIRDQQLEAVPRSILESMYGVVVTRLVEPER